MNAFDRIVRIQNMLSLTMGGSGDGLVSLAANQFLLLDDRDLAKRKAEQSSSHPIPTKRWVASWLGRSCEGETQDEAAELLAKELSSMVLEDIDRKIVDAEAKVAMLRHQKDLALELTKQCR